jgi:hypothetical protein
VEREGEEGEKEKDFHGLDKRGERERHRGLPLSLNPNPNTKTLNLISIIPKIQVFSRFPLFLFVSLTLFFFPTYQPLSHFIPLFLASLPPPLSLQSNLLERDGSTLTYLRYNFLQVENP